MTDDGAYEVMHAGRVHRAASMDTVLRWARERRITGEDSYRKAGEDRWNRVADHSALAEILDPSTWWTVKMDDREYTAPDFETVVEWTREGRVSTEAVIEGPRTPPGGVLASGLPGLAPFLREPPAREPSEEPPRVRIDGREYGARTSQTAGATCGALGGAAAGAALGSVVPVVGTTVGALVGGLIGGTGGSLGGRRLGDRLFHKARPAADSEGAEGWVEATVAEGEGEP